MTTYFVHDGISTGNGTVKCTCGHLLSTYVPPHTWVTSNLDPDPDPWQVAIEKAYAEHVKAVTA